MQLKNGFHLMTTSTHLLPAVPQHNNNQPFSNVNLAVNEVQVFADDEEIPLRHHHEHNNVTLYSLYDDEDNVVDAQLPRPSENLKFLANEYGFLELLDEHNGSSSSSSGSSDEDDLLPENPSIDTIETISSCVTCGCYGLLAEFYDSKHCTHDCSVITRINERKMKKELEEKELEEKELEEKELEEKELEEKEAEEAQNRDGEQPNKRIKLEVVVEEEDQLNVVTDDDTSPLRMLDNPFRVNDLLEAIDPQHQSLFCPVTVVEVIGYRLLLKFIGYSDKYNFWANADSKYIFPVRWSARFNSISCFSQLHFHGPPNFSWDTHISGNEGGRVAPDSNFPHVLPILSNKDCSGVRVGMKVEAVDRRNKNLICVATVSCVLGDRFLIHFDSWDSLYDYWTFIGSGDVFYCGYCKDNKIEITPPHCYENASEFDWEEYLKKTNSVAMPRDLMKHSVQSMYSVGDQVEVIDKRSPRLLRISSITGITGTTQTLSIHFPSLKSNVYDYDLHAFSENIHPLGWGASTGHPLADEEDESPRRSPSPDNFPTCPNIRICKSVCNVRGPNFPFHSKIRDCPYSATNMQEYSESGKFTDRVVVFEDAHYDLGGGASGEKHEEKVEKPVVKTSLPVHHRVTPMNKPSNPINFNNLTSSRVQNGGKDPDIPRRSEILSWSHDRISALVQSLCSNLPTAHKVADQFRTNLIDGESFLMLTQSDMTEALGIKLGPAVKIYNLIRLIDLNK